MKKKMINKCKLTTLEGRVKLATAAGSAVFSSLLLKLKQPIFHLAKPPGLVVLSTFLAGGLCVSSTACLADYVFPETHPNIDTQLYPWVLEKEADHIQIETRYYPGSKFKMFRAQLNLGCSQEQVMAVLKDTAHYPEWHHNISSIKVLKATSEGSLAYCVHDLPWPISNRDSIVFSQQKQLAPNVIQILLSDRQAEVPLQDDLIRIASLKGYWGVETSQQAGKVHTKVTYQVAVNPGGHIHSWFANHMVVESPFRTLSQLEQRLAHCKLP